MIQYKIYNSYKNLPKKAWDSLAFHDIFLQTKYLQALEKALPNSISIYYIGVFNNQDLIGIAIVQRVQLYLSDMFRNSGVSCLKERIQNTISKVLKGNILVIGNLTHTGQHGFFFNKKTTSQKDFLNIIFDAVDELCRVIKSKNGKRIRLILFKDYFKDDAIHIGQELFESLQYYKMEVQPNMLMQLKPNWIHMDDYIGNMTTKYRTRYNRARKMYQGILTVELDIEAVKNHSKEIYKLYKNVSDNAAFNTFILPENHFLSLKEHLKDDFRIFGYYLDNELIGFYSLIQNSEKLETYFLGYDAIHQYPNQLYLNMLYDMASFGIENKFKYVVYARTAMEIKSSVGAKPEAMFMYLKYTNGIVNRILKQVFNLMNPSPKWQERHPFKD